MNQFIVEIDAQSNLADTWMNKPQMNTIS